eukprot:scaffold81979_cov48-Prasinocladus_malaysianus.AAC.1
MNTQRLHEEYIASKSYGRATTARDPLFVLPVTQICTVLVLIVSRTGSDWRLRGTGLYSVPYSAWTALLVKQSMREQKYHRDVQKR